MKRRIYLAVLPTLICILPLQAHAASKWRTIICESTLDSQTGKAEYEADVYEFGRWGSVNPIDPKIKSNHALFRLERHSKNVIKFDAQVRAPGGSTGFNISNYVSSTLSDSVRIKNSRGSVKVNGRHFVKLAKSESSEQDYYVNKITAHLEFPAEVLTQVGAPNSGFIQYKQYRLDHTMAVKRCDFVLPELSCVRVR